VRITSDRPKPSYSPRSGFCSVNASSVCSSFFTSSGANARSSPNISSRRCVSKRIVSVDLGPIGTFSGMPKKKQALCLPAHHALAEETEKTQQTFEMLASFNA